MTSTIRWRRSITAHATSRANSAAISSGGETRGWPRGVRARCSATAASIRTTPSTSSWTSASATGYAAPSTSSPTATTARATAPISSRTPGCARSSAASAGVGTRWGFTRASARIATPRGRARSWRACCASPRPRACARTSGADASTSCAGPIRIRGATGRPPGSTTTARSAYAEAVGFRTGTCHPYRVFDLRERRPLRLREMPFQIMDVTLLSSMALTLDAARAAVHGDRRRMPAIRRLPRDPLAQQHAAAHGPREALVRGACRCGDSDLASCRARSGPEVVQSGAAPRFAAWLFYARHQ